MRILAAEPETKRFVGRNFLQKFLERFGLRSGRIARPAAGLKISGAPPFAGVADDVSGTLEDVRIRFEFFGQKSPEHGALFKLMNGATGQHGSARRRAARRGRQSAFARHALEIWNAHDAITVNSGMRPGPIVGETK